MSDLDDALVHSVIEHMNSDHADTVLLYVQAMASPPPATSAEIIAMDSRGIDIAWQGDKQTGVVQLAFQQPVQDAESARRELVALAKAARGA